MQQQVETHPEIDVIRLFGGRPVGSRGDCPANPVGEIRVAETRSVDLPDPSFLIDAELRFDPPVVPGEEDVVLQFEVTEHPAFELGQTAAPELRHHLLPSRLPRRVGPDREIDRDGVPDPHGLTLQHPRRPGGRTAHHADDGFGQEGVGRRQRPDPAHRAVAFDNEADHHTALDTASERLVGIDQPLLHPAAEFFDAPVPEDGHRIGSQVRPIRKGIGQRTGRRI